VDLRRDRLLQGFHMLPDGASSTGTWRVLTTLAARSVSRRDCRRRRRSDGLVPSIEYSGLSSRNRGDAGRMHWRSSSRRRSLPGIAVALRDIGHGGRDRSIEQRREI
jgi:hypothetical protein